MFDLFHRANIADYDKKKYNDVMYDRIYDPTFTGGVQLHTRYIYSIAFQSNGEIVKRLLREPFITEFCGMEFPRNHKLFYVLDHKIHQLFESGITEYLASYGKKRLDPNVYKKPKSLTREYLYNTYEKLFPEGAQILTMDHLEAGFVIWIACVSLAIAAFIFEWMMMLKNYLITWYVLQAFCERKCEEPKMRENLTEISCYSEDFGVHNPDELDVDQINEFYELGEVSCNSEEEYELNELASDEIGCHYEVFLAELCDPIDSLPRSE